MFLKRKSPGHCAAQHCVTTILVYVTAVDELICRPLTRDYMETELHKAMQRSFVHTVTMKSLWNDFWLLCIVLLIAGVGVKRESNTEVLNYCGYCELTLNYFIYSQGRGFYNQALTIHLCSEMILEHMQLQVDSSHSYLLMCFTFILHNNTITFILFRLLTLQRCISLWYELCAFPVLCHWHITRSFCATNQLPRDLQQLSLMHDLHMLFHACFTAYITLADHAEYWSWTIWPKIGIRMNCHNYLDDYKCVSFFVLAHFWLVFPEQSVQRPLILLMNRVCQVPKMQGAH